LTRKAALIARQPRAGVVGEIPAGGHP
jgi:hypothetical protein